MEVTSRLYLEPQAVEHFKLDEDPFNDPESPEDIWLSPALRRIEGQLVNGIKRRHIVVVTGEVGAGKSTLLRRLYGRLVQERHLRFIAPASLDRRKITETALAVAILRDLTGKDTSSMAMEARSEMLRVQLSAEGAAGNYPVLLVDEAHHLPNKGLVAIKQVWDSHTMFKQLAVILVGQPPLAARLRQDITLREVTGRAVMCEVPTFNRDPGCAAADYVRWRFARVGADADAIFKPDAYAALGARAEHPLWLNNLAVRALLYAWSVGDTTVTSAHVGRA